MLSVSEDDEKNKVQKLETSGTRLRLEIPEDVTFSVKEN